MSAILGFTVGGIIIAYVRERNFKHFSFNKRFVESVWPAEYKNQKDYSGFQNSRLYFPSMKRFQRYPKFADRKIPRFTGFFNLLKTSAQSSEYIFKKLKIVILVFFIDNAVLQLITAKGSSTPKPTYQITADSWLRNLKFSATIFIFYRSYDGGTWIIWLHLSTLAVVIILG